MRYTVTITHDVIDDPHDDEHPRLITEHVRIIDASDVLDPHDYLPDEAGDFNGGCTSDGDCGEHIQDLDIGEDGYFTYIGAHPEPTNCDGYSRVVVAFARETAH